MHCHAPLLEHASEALMADIGALVVAAFDGKEAAKKELSRLNVNCIVCHNTAAIVETNLRGLPKPGVYYGPTGKTTPAHGTEKSAAITTSAFCSRCHWLYTPPDGDTLYCNTLYGSYQDAYRASGGAATCQDCHMKSKGRGHTFPGAYEPEMVREGISMDLQATGATLLPGKGIKTALINVGLMNNAGHRIPDG
jgi:mono/diheme cytochrome c family protein